MLTRRRLLATPAAGLLFAVSGVTPQAFAESNRKPLRIIVGFPPGGNTDVVARIFAERLRLSYVSTVIVENKTGASSRLAVEYVKEAAPDGSVLLHTTEGPIALFPHYFRKLNYEPLRDLTPVAPTAKSMLVFVIGPAVPQGVQSLSGFLQWCKANPDHATFAANTGGPSHFVGFMLAAATGVQFAHVPYKGSAPVLTALLGGHVAASVTLVNEVLPLAKSGTLRALAVTGLRRSQFLPAVPTMRELNYDVVVDLWWTGMFAPAGLPVETLRALNVAIGEAAKSPEVAEQLAEFGTDPMVQSPEEFTAMVRRDIERWGRVVKASGFVSDESLN